MLRYLLTLTAAAVVAAPALAEATSWTGDIHLAPGTTLKFTAALAPDGGTMDIPAQGVAGATLADVRIDGPDLAFTLKPAGAGEAAFATFTARLMPDGKAGLALMRQMGMIFAVTLAGDADAPPVGEHAAAITEAEDWRGRIHLPGAQKLDFTMRITPGDPSPAAAMSIPAQGLVNGTLSIESMDSRVMRFTLKTAPAEQTWARFTALRSADGSSAIGHLSQMGGLFGVELERAVEGKASTLEVRRPQHPVPPFPYSSREVSIKNEADGVSLAGTLTMPQGSGPHPAVILITGSGSQDRDETLFEHKPFLVIADHFTRRGIAVLRCDDRGVGGSTGDPEHATSADFARDVRAKVEFLKIQPDIDPRRIGLVGHSEGGVIAPMVAAETDDVAFIVLMAGTGLPGREIALRQSELMARAAGADQAMIDQNTRQLPIILDLIEQDAPTDAIAQAIREMGEQQLRDAGMDPGTEESRRQVEGVVEMQTQQLASAWMRWFIKHDPREALRRVRCPVLAINGSLDTQVPAAANLAEIRKALEEGGNTSIRIVELEGLNHLFQTAKTGALDEYGRIEETFSPAALNLMSDWIRSVAGLTN